MSTTAAKAKKAPTDFRTANVQLEVKIDAPAQRVWDAMVKETTHWWRKDFLTKESKGFYIEPRIGGKMYEDRGDGNGLIWAEVIGVDAPNSIQMLGILSAEYGGPAHTIMKFAVEAAGENASIVKITDTIWGNLSESAGSTMHEGWTILFQQSLKEYVESGKRA